MEDFVDSENDCGQGAEVNATSEASASRDKTNHWLAYLGMLGFGLVGGIVGYLGHGLQVNEAAKDADSSVREVGETAGGPCREWADAICSELGEETYTCRQARNAGTLLLSGSACAQAQKGVVEKIEELRVGRAPCSDLSRRLCEDLGPDEKGCELIKAKTPTFSVKGCEEMAQDYHQVLAHLMSQQKRGTLPQ